MNPITKALSAAFPSLKKAPKKEQTQSEDLLQIVNQPVDRHLHGLTASKIIEEWRAADGGNILAQHQLFEDMVDSDAHLRCEYDKRRSAPLTLSWRIAPPPDASKKEREIAATIESWLRDAVSDLDDVMFVLMDAVGQGFAAVEMEWHRQDNIWLPEFFPRPQTWFQLNHDRTELTLRDNTPDGRKLEDGVWIFHQPSKPKTGYIPRAALFRVLAFPFLYKNLALSDFAGFLETYGLPIILGKHDPNARQDEKMSLLRSIRHLGHSARAIMPDTMAVEIEKIAASGDGDTYMKMVEWADAAISRAILGQTLSSTAASTGLGSGVASFQAEVRRDILLSDCRQLADTLTRDLIYPLVVFNTSGINSFMRCPRFAFETNAPEDIKTYAEALPRLVEIGMKIPAAWAHEQLCIPQPEDDEEVLSLPQAESAPSGALRAALKGTPVKAETLPRLDRWTAMTETAMEGPANEVRKILETLVQKSKSYDDLFEKIKALSLPEKEAGEILTEALVFADLVGRYDVMETIID